MSEIEKLIQYIEGKTILIVGGSPSASNKEKKWYDTFDIIVRFNNYKKINSDRTDIYFSYFGKNITKQPQELKNDGVKFLINKCPNINMTKDLKGYHIQMADYRWIYDLRKNWWFCPVISLSKEELLGQIKILEGYMPSVGLSAILFFSKYIKPIHIIGFDCFESGIHNLNEKWDGSGNHKPLKEKAVLESLEEEKKIVWHK